MFEVGFTEIVLILGLALLVLGPEKLPGLAQKVGRWTGRARAMARQLRTQLEQEVTLEEMSRSRPMQPGASPGDSVPSGHSNDPQESPFHSESATTGPLDAAEARPHEPQIHSDSTAHEPPHSGPGLDLDRHVSGIEPEPAPLAATADAPDPKHAQ